MYHVVICKEDYRAPFGNQALAIFQKGEVYQAENHDEEFRVWRNKSSFLKFSPGRFEKYFRIFC